MRPKKIVFALFVFIAAVVVRMPAQTSTDQIVQRAMQQRQQLIESRLMGTVRVEAQKETMDLGTGLVLSSSPEKILILTALHVVDGAKSVNVFFYSDKATPVPVQVLPSHSDNLDLAVLEAQASATRKLPSNIQPFNFAANNTLEIGATIYTVDGNWTPVQNTIARLSYEGDPQKFMYTSVSVGKGFSGGPIFDQYGDVIGMHDAMLKDHSYAIGIKIDSALQVLEALNYSVPKAGPIVMPYGLGQNAANRPTTPLAPATPAIAQAPAATGPCQKGCEAKLSDLKLVQNYGSNASRLVMHGGCQEKVLQMPKDWPGSNLFLHISQCQYSGTGKTGVRIGFGTTDRKQDIDMGAGVLNFSAYSGKGYLYDENHTMWEVTLRSDTLNSIEFNTTTIAVQPVGGLRVALPNQ